MISYFTDGSTAPTNPGPGGFAVIKNGTPYLIGGEAADSAISRDHTTNIRMEARAIFMAMDDFATEKSAGRLAKRETAVLTTDSQFWINVLTKWAPTWSRNNWTKKGGIKNLDLVVPLFAKYREFVTAGGSLSWTRGHVGTELNELADHWANEARRRALIGSQKV